MQKPSLCTVLRAMLVLFLVCGCRTFFPAPARQATEEPATLFPSRTPAVKTTPTPEGTGRIAFTSTRDGNYEIYVMNADGTGLVNLTKEPTADMDPAWSPDGSKIAFVAYRDGNNEIYVMNADGSDPLRLTYDGGQDFNPTWSPDGKRIAFISSRDGGTDVHIVQADGSRQYNLTHSPGMFDDSPAWSPDGRQIVFAPFACDACDPVLTLIDPDDQSSNMTVISKQPATDPAWSPDGLRIAFCGIEVGLASEIYVVPVDGGASVRLTDNTEQDDQPDWSPDGTKIAFVSERDGNREVYIMNADGSGQINLTNDPGLDESPSWHP